ncbi:serine protease [Kitasatospora cinereorecta]|uniref:Trypsin-like serine peptidase n=1 Tax=Kitasatospora cinereorecta TaxID=285560 RepID=A0ABW0VHZ7_9ACTN
MRRALRPVAVTSVLAVGLIGAIAGATELTTHFALADRPTAELPVTASVLPGATASAPPSATPTPEATASASATATASDGTVVRSTATVDPHLATVPSYSPPPELGKTATAPDGAESARVGALFTGSVAAGNHFCTASVLHSTGKDLILTAAHCLSSTDNVRFVPGYRDGQAPYGSWKVTRIFTADGWQNGSDPDEDFAVLQVAQNGGRDIEDVVGANTLGLNAGWSDQVRLYGYPGDTEMPILCTNATTKQDTFQRTISCPAFPGGTSGGPWIDTTTGQVIGIIGGYEQGGDSDDVSYSAYFDHTIGDLYRKADAATS